jgi:hypothetical protein
MAIVVPTTGSKITAAWGTSVANQLNLPFRVAGSSFASDLTSTGATEVMGYSQSAALTNGSRYRVWVKAYFSPGGANGQAVARVRYDTAAVTNASTKAGADYIVLMGALSAAGRTSGFFMCEFVAPSTNTFNIAVGIATFSGGGNTLINGASIPTEITIDQVG